jgi:hypothetical protein
MMSLRFARSSISSACVCARHAAAISSSAVKEKPTAREPVGLFSTADLGRELIL